MIELPQFVRERMRAQAIAGAHPDADLLNAFAESVLGVRERDLVLEHLATCRACREVVALALPEMPQQVLVPQRRWFRAPAMKWVAATAAVVVVGAAVTLRRDEVVAPPVSPQERMAAEATTSSAAPEQAQSEAVQTAKSAPASVPKRKDAAERSAKSTATASRDLARDEVTRNEAASAPALMSKRRADAVELKDEKRTVTSKELGQQGYGNSYIIDRQGAGNATEERPAVAQVMVAPAPAPSPPAAMRKQSVMRNPEAPPAESAADAAAQKVETYSVEVAGAAASETRVNVGDGWVEVTPEGRLARHSGSGIVVRQLGVAHLTAIARIDNVLWAGGREGQLFVSRDDGRTWGEISSPTNERVVRISGSGEYIALRTATRSYTSRDGGKSWTEQR